MESIYDTIHGTEVLESIRQDLNDTVVLKHIISQLSYFLTIEINTENCSDCICTFEGLNGEEFTLEKFKRFLQNRTCDHSLEEKVVKRKVTCGTTWVHIAAAAGSTRILEFVRKNGATFNLCTSRFKYSPLHVAVLHGRHDTVRYLLQEGIPLENKCLYNGKLWKTALSLACEREDVEMVKILQTAGADIDKELRETLNRGDALQAETLVKAGAEINVPFPPQYVTPLIMAVTMNRGSLVRSLLEHGADINQTNKGNLTAIHIGLNKGLKEIAHTLLPHALKLNIESAARKCLLHAAIRGKNVDLFETVLGVSLDIDEQDNELRTPLHLAVESNTETFVCKLLEKGCQIDIQDKYGATPLGLAVHKGNIKIVSAIIIGGSDVNIRGLPRYLIPTEDSDLIDEINSSLLYGAVSMQHYQIAAMLIEAGIDLSQEKWIFADSSSQKKLIDKRFRNKFEKIKSSPQNLQFICRRLIRSTFKDRLKNYLHGLNLSSQMKEYLLLEYL